MKPLGCWLLSGLFCILAASPPLQGQTFDELVTKLSGPPDTKPDEEKKEQAPLPQGPLPPSSTDLGAAAEENPLAPEENIPTNGVVLQGLDKLTGWVFFTNAKVGQTIKFGALEIVVHRCEKAPLGDRQESMAFLKIKEVKPNTDPQVIFSGWMLASSPALSSFDHPTYDVWIKECKDISPPKRKEQKDGHGRK